MQYTVIGRYDFTIMVLVISYDNNTWSFKFFFTFPPLNPQTPPSQSEVYTQ